MNLRELEQRLRELAISMDTQVDNVRDAAIKAQREVFTHLVDEIDNFEIDNGRYVTGQNYAKKFADIEAKIEEITNRYYKPKVQEYLQHYNTIQDTTISLQSGYNNIEVSKSLLNPVKQAMYNQSSYYLIQGLGDAYIQPAKFLMMEYVTKGSTVKQMRSAITNWDKGTLNTGELASDIHAPRLHAYATQIARDTMYSYQGTMQEVIRKEYSLSKIIYVGSLVKDSRQLCRHLVSLKRKIDLSEIPKLLITYPEGLKPGTTIENFTINRGGFNCNHTSMVVR